MLVYQNCCLLEGSNLHFNISDSTHRILVVQNTCGMSGFIAVLLASLQDKLSYGH
uniref:Uncharacterized protein n=1 Tax=Arundo donax TaxID=35708 RepID=A0A0A9HDK8_ARUDO